MTTLYMDGEWNGYGGELISLALISENNHIFYATLPCDDPIPWVEKNVMCWIEDGDWLTREEMQIALQQFLGQFDEVTIVVDWPEDIAYFCQLIVTGPGTRIDTPPLTFEVYRVDPVSHRPHHALWDAMALRDLLTGKEVASNA